MSLDTETSFDLDNFYSADSIHDWQRIIGADLHYHLGYFLGSEDLETGLKQTVRNYYAYIPSGASVLDVGCGWGGPARLLTSEQGCTVTGITISTAQANYCRSLGLTVQQQDLDQATQAIPTDYDVIFSLEMLSHSRNKADLLRRLQSCGKRLVLSVNCAADNYAKGRLTFGDSMELCTVSELVQAVEAAGWHICWMRDRRFQALRTFILWRQNLDHYYGEHTPPGQLEVLRRHANTALKSPIQWCHAFPLIDIVAD